MTRTPADDQHPILPGSEAWSAPGGPHGVLVLHGFTGNPSSMRGLAEAFAAAGFAVEMPRLPGHGTHVDDMIETTFADWAAEADRVYAQLAAQCTRVVVAGLSMGGALTCWLAVQHPEIAAIVVINAPMQVPDELAEGVRQLVETGQETMDAIGGDVADPESPESSYDKTPLRPLLTMVEAGQELRGRLSEITCPALIITSTNDHVVNPADSDLLAAAVSGPVERVILDKSFHVATIDYDKDIVFDRAVEFAQRITS
jgi:carboxylesterase